MLVKIFHVLGLALLFGGIWYLFEKIAHKRLTSLQIKGKTFKTILPVVESIVRWLLLIIGGLCILNQFLDIAPLIYGLSFLGLAASMGAQTLIKDIINGVINLFEGNIAVGDTVTIGTSKGTVESVSLRCIILRHSEGELQTIPFSEVTRIMNHSRDYSVTMVELVLEPTITSSEVEAFFEKISQNLEPDLAVYIHTKPQFDLIKVDDKGVTIRFRIKTKPDPQRFFFNAFHKKVWEELLKTPLPLSKPFPF